METLDEIIELGEGSIHVRVLGRSGGADVELAPPRARLEVEATSIRLAAEGDPAPDGIARLRLANHDESPAVVSIERASWAADAVLGTVVISFPEFHDLFATEAPASGVELRVGQLALLFSDLTGSTALYERVGDARAFAIVEEHLRVPREQIDAFGGSVIKTMGDAIMASFPSLSEAVAAGRALIEAHDRHPGFEGLGVKVGAYGGPCLAVRANDRLDFFGTTVNLAVRSQAQASASELVLAESCLEEPGIAELLDGLPRRRFNAALKGIAEEQPLVGFDCGAREPEAAYGGGGSTTPSITTQ